MFRDKIVAVLHIDPSEGETGDLVVLLAVPDHVGGQVHAHHLEDKILQFLFSIYKYRKLLHSGYILIK